MNMEKIISDIVTRYGWKLLSIDDHDYSVADLDFPEYFITLHNDALGVGIGFYIEFGDPDTVYSNSYWSLDAVDFPIIYADVESLMGQISRMWEDIEDAFYGVNYFDIIGVE